MSDELIRLHKLLKAEEAYQLRSKDDLWYKGELRSLCHSAQHLIYDAFYSTTCREHVILASRRFGKSYLGLILCIEHAIRHPHSVTRFIPPEIKQGWQIAMPTMAKLSQSYPSGLIRFNVGEKAWKIGQDSWLYLGGFDSQKDAQRGGEASLIVCDEAAFTNPEEYDYILRSVLKPQLLTTRGRLLQLSTPARIPDHPFMSQTVADAELEGRLHRFTIYDNPLLDEDQIEEAKRDCGGEDSESWQVEYLCKTVRSPSLMVLPRWSPDYLDEWAPEPWHYRCLVGDFGGVTDKTVLQVLAYDYRSPIDGTWHYIDERVYDSNTTTQEIVAGIQDLHAHWIATSKAPEQDTTCYLDCPGQLQVDLNNHHNINVRIPIKDDFHAGVNLINLFVKQNRVRVHKRCTFTAMSFNAARFNDRRTDYIRSPVLGHCDAVACAIYGLRMICRDRDGSPEPRINREQQAYWKQATFNKYQQREQVAAAIYGGKK